MASGSAFDAREHESLVRKIGQIVTEVSGITVESHDDLKASGIDSMQMLEILALLEDEFGIGIAENMIREFRSLDRIVRLVKDMLEAPGR